MCDIKRKGLFLADSQDENDVDLSLWVKNLIVF